MAGTQDPRDYCWEVRDKRGQGMSPETTEMDSSPFKNARG